MAIEPVTTHESEQHDYSDLGFCRRCGCHQEMAAYEDLLCVWSSNTVAISHLRAVQILGAEQRNKALDQLRNPEPAS